ncbi:MAG TPA: type III-B CRISPR-associated protein Cas10/Cmr2, partial [Gammaproteobacteria bacterium]|nr:type III-B CRISPR-associated protein Cas10/Cmr2 [Gammaproteobacteria bacterium]
KGNAGIYDALPFDASLVYPDRLNTMIADCQSGKLDTGLGKTLEELRTLLRPIWKHHSVPDPYYALMLADGDRMGELLGNARSEGEHRAISSRLAHFAQEVPGRVRKYRGHCIYAGGDDVLAMVSLSQAIELADDLRGFFSHELGDIAKQLGAPMPTFSVGLVFAHMQSPLGLTRRLASRAEQLAKGDESDNPRNALGILVAPRSGAPVELRTIWGDDVNAPYRQILELIGSYADNELPSGFAYEVRTLANMLEGSEPADAQRIAQLELKRLLSHKNRDQGSRPVTLQTIRSVLEQAHDLPLEQVVQAHIVSRWIGQHLEECP